MLLFVVACALAVGWADVLHFVPKSDLVQTVECPGGRVVCLDGQTCCQISSGYGCCPYLNAVCCSDRTHCCPSGYTCDVAAGSCKQGSLSIPWYSKIPSVSLTAVKSGEESAVNSVICPSGKSECPDGTTCCKLSSGQYGCCPMPKAVCCSDHLHCCPSKTTCDVAAGTCKRGTLSIPWYSKIPSVSLTTAKSGEESAVNSITCEDGSKCPDGTTCCKLSSGQYGCCPMPKAVCCSDLIHCCPSGYTCAVESCNKGTLSIPWYSKIPSVSLTTAKSGEESAVNSITCEDGSKCLGGTTCCKLSSGQYGCCPMPKAVCCSDLIHCCPSGYTCAVESCNKGTLSIPWYSKIPSVSLTTVKSGEESAVNSITCEDGSKCLGGTTCCKLSSGKYGCCPLPNAVCCSDHLHCCPSKTTCDVAAGTCKRGTLSIPWYSKIPSVSLTTAKSGEESAVNSITCEDGSKCPDGTTCCKLSSGQYGCCPMPKAVCCSDLIHCCPSGYTCAVESCNKGTLSIPWYSKIPSVSLTTAKSGEESAVNSITCEDGSKCLGGTTCCKLSSGQYGCCPMPKAVCCSDLIHCCPSGYTCAVESCNKGTLSIPWYSKIPSVSLTTVKSGEESAVNSITCEDGSKCLGGTTCCKLSSGKYGCCPLPNAVCCSDRLHCCPSKTTCDVAAGTCKRGTLSIPWYSKIPSVSLTTAKSGEESAVNSITCEDGSKCPDGTTCCKLSSGQYGCCPMPKAVCCSDLIHCCPSGYTCAVESCNKGTLSIPWYSKIPSVSLTTAKSGEESAVNSITCEDGSKCLGGTTCCKLSSGQYGCCPMPKAVCCSDLIHCCPSGYTCAVESCNKGTLSIPWYSKIPSVSLTTVKSGEESAVNSITCEDGSKCLGGTTCCKLSSGKYGCCPLPNAVCCSDHVHCCPKGTTCDVSQRSCKNGPLNITWFNKRKSTPSH